MHRSTQSAASTEGKHLQHADSPSEVICFCADFRGARRPARAHINTKARLQRGDQVQRRATLKVVVGRRLVVVHLLAAEDESLRGSRSAVSSLRRPAAFSLGNAAAVRSTGSTLLAGDNGTGAGIHAAEPRGRGARRSAPRHKQGRHLLRRGDALLFLHSLLDALDSVCRLDVEFNLLACPPLKRSGLAAPAAPAEPRARACQRPQTRLPRCAGRSPAGNPARTRRQRGRADSNAAPAPARGAPRTHGPLEPPCKPRGCWREPRVSRENVGRARGQAPARSESPPGARACGRHRRRRLTCQRLDLDLHRAAPPLNPVYRSAAAVVVSRPSWRVHELKLGSWLQQFASRLRLLQRARAAHSARPPAGGRAPP